MSQDRYLRDFRTAAEVPSWAFRFYLRHFVWIAGLSLIPSVHRFVWLYFEPDWSPSTVLFLEIFVESFRLLLLWLIIKVSMVRDAQLRGMDSRERWSRMKSFVRNRWPSLVFQLLLMALATLIFNTLLEGIAGLWLPEDMQGKYLAILLAIKNPTVIAWTLVWMVGIPRQMMILGGGH